MSPQPELDASRANGASHQPPWNTPLSLPDPLLIRKTLISLAIMSVVSGLTLATAQDQNKASHLRAASTTRNDRDFVAMMMPHHQGAIDLARAEVKYGHNEKLRQLALSMIVEREHEMSVMRNPFGEPATSDTSEHSSDGRSREE
jgi:hypothetical protein